MFVTLLQTKHSTSYNKNEACAIIKQTTSPIIEPYSLLKSTQGTNKE